MKLSAQEEYGIRCLLHLARVPAGQSMTIPEISQAEGLSVPNVAKLMRLLRMGGLVQSERGQSGGYMLSRPPAEIAVLEALNILGGQFFSAQFCERHAGRQEVCAHSIDCSLRVLWNTIETSMREVLGKTSLKDLLCSEAEMTQWLAARNGNSGGLTHIHSDPPPIP
ncbi:MAG: Rrf2 family transcriptional regulator [Bryobacteraceae bacterium]